MSVLLLYKLKVKFVIKIRTVGKYTLNYIIISLFNCSFYVLTLKVYETGIYVMKQKVLQFHSNAASSLL